MNSLHNLSFMSPGKFQIHGITQSVWLPNHYPEGLNCFVYKIKVQAKVQSFESEVSLQGLVGQKLHCSAALCMAVDQGTQPTAPRLDVACDASLCGPFNVSVT